MFFIHALPLQRKQVSRLKTCVASIIVRPRIRTSQYLLVSNTKKGTTRTPEDPMNLGLGKN